MTISSTLSNAMSGLTMNARAAQLISDNVANAMTEGYGRRLLETSGRALGGVQVDGIVRVGDPRLLYDRRAADAELGGASVGSDALSRLMDIAGTPDDPASLGALLAEFDARLVLAASDPSDSQRLGGAVDAARDLLDKIGTIADAIQAERKQAERDISVGVERLNSNLAEIHRLNVAVAAARATGGDSSGLEDQRQVLIDEVSEWIPIREFPRQNGVLALMSEGGQMLLDGPPRAFAFTVSNEITPNQTHAAGLLSGLTFGGDPVAIDPDGKLAGGKLIALFDIRDRDMVAAQEGLDAFARDLVTRLQSPAVDPTLGAADAGFFTDGGAAFAAVDEVGLSTRLELNARIDPAQGGALFRLRDGLNAAAPGPVGDATLLNAMRGALNTATAPPSGLLAGQGATIAEGAAAWITEIAMRSEANDRRMAFASARTTELRSQELSQGVDTDAELQKLLVVERLYAANARVIETVDEMLAAIMRI